MPVVHRRCCQCPSVGPPSNVNSRPGGPPTRADPRPGPRRRSTFTARGTGTPGARTPLPANIRQHTLARRATPSSPQVVNCSNQACYGQGALRLKLPESVRRGVRSHVGPAPPIPPSTFTGSEIPSPVDNPGILLPLPVTDSCWPRTVGIRCSCCNGSGKEAEVRTLSLCVFATSWRLA